MPLALEAELFNTAAVAAWEEAGFRPERKQLLYSQMRRWKPGWTASAGSLGTIATDAAENSIN